MPEPMPDLLALLGDAATWRRLAPFHIAPAQDAAATAAYRRLRRRVFVDEQGLFDRDDHDAFDDDPRTVVLLARDQAGEVAGGVRLHPAVPGDPDLGWWYGSRLAVDPAHRHRVRQPGNRSSRTSAWLRAQPYAPHHQGGGAGEADSVGPALIQAACAYAEAAGVLRFDAVVQQPAERMFRRLGWVTGAPVTVAARPHVLMRWPVGRIAAQAAAAKAPLGSLVAGLAGGPGFVGDDGVPVPGSDLVAACDAIIPALVERDPEWAGWCAVLVNVNDLCAMGAEPVGLLDALGARDASFAARVLAGLRRGAEAYGVPVLGGHTQLGVPAALSVTALGRVPGGLAAPPGGSVPDGGVGGVGGAAVPGSGFPGGGGPVPGGGGRPGHQVRLTVDLAGQWRPGYAGRQWDSTSHRSPAELRAMVRCLTHARPAAAKDVSMAGIAGTLGMLAEASGCGAVLDVAALPRPAGVSMGDWLTCFPGFGLLTAAPAGTAGPPAGPATSAACGELVPGAGVRLRWPDGVETVVIDGPVTGLGAAGAADEVTAGSSHGRSCGERE